MIYNGSKILFYLKISTAVILSLFLFIVLESRGHPFSYFSTRCIDYKQKEYGRRLNDRLVDYVAEAKRRGVTPSRNDKDLKKKISEGRLVKVRTGSLYILDNLTFSSPVLTKESKILLDEIAERFRKKTSRKGLQGVRFHVTSLTRKTEHLRKLRRYNTNSSENSPHLYGSAFDISYKRFTVRKLVQTNCDKKYLKEALAEVIWELRNEKRCWATYERMQNCYHVVAR